VIQTSPSLSYELRHYRDDDESRVLGLINLALGGGPVGGMKADFFRWKHLDNPFGRSHILVAESEGSIVGVRPFMRWRFASGSRSIPAVRAVDTATHPDFQRMGMFSRLTSQALKELRVDTAFVFNTPNAKSLPGYIKLGWQPVGEVPISLRIRKPVRFARRLGSWQAGGEVPASNLHVGGDRAIEVLCAEEEVESLLQEASSDKVSLMTPRDIPVLRWRYGGVPSLSYRVVTEQAGGRLVGMAVFRVRPRGRLTEATVADVIVRPADVATARRLLRSVSKAAPVDHITCQISLDATLRGASWRAGFLRSPKGPLLTVNPLDRSVEPNPLHLSSWRATLSDLEVF
jgi:hypothetical protein